MNCDPCTCSVSVVCVVCLLKFSWQFESKLKPYLSLPGLAQCTELCLQLRGQADQRQVPNAKIALQHNLGLGGAVVVALYKMGFTDNNK